MLDSQIFILKSVYKILKNVHFIKKTGINFLF